MRAYFRHMILQMLAKGRRVNSWAISKHDLDWAGKIDFLRVQMLAIQFF